MLTSINVVGLTSYGYHGLFDEERTLGQKFTFDIEANLREVNTHRDDNLDSSIRYDAVVEEALALAGASQFQTLEALGEAIAKGLLGRFGAMDSITVGVSKLSPPIPHAIRQVGIRVSLKRAELLAA